MPNYSAIRANMRDDCKLHGRVEYVKSKIADGYICIECVYAGYYRTDITTEIKTNYPLNLAERAKRRPANFE